MFLDVCKIGIIANIFPGHHLTLSALAELNCPVFIFCYCGDHTTTVGMLGCVHVSISSHQTDWFVGCRYLCSQRC